MTMQMVMPVVTFLVLTVAAVWVPLLGMALLQAKREAGWGRREMRAEEGPRVVRMR